MLYKVPHKMLSTECQEVVGTDNLKDIYSEMKTAMYMNKGVGLAANQIGYPIRMFCWDAGKEYRMHGFGRGVIINPEISFSSVKKINDMEGCLSIPFKYFTIERATTCTLKGYDLDGKELSMFAEGHLARIFQHEVDHLQGLTILDRI